MEESAVPRGSSAKRERQYEHIEEGAEKRGIDGRSSMNKQQLAKALGR